MSTPFRVDLDDLEFIFFEQLRAHERLVQFEPYRELDADTYRATFAEAARLATGVLSPINRVGDREGCKLDGEGNVTTPTGFRGAWRQMAEGGWIAPSAPVELGGAGMPRCVTMAVNDMFDAAAIAFMMYPGLTAAAGRMVRAFGPENTRDMVAGKLFGGQWGGTMCLTESGAGSSVGDNRARATPSDEPGVWLLEGEKIFISGGDSDLVENVVHLVLARTPDSPNGTKGLSLFLVPKFMFDEGGKLGARNGAKVVGIEHKMGINGSATCTLALGADTPCKGWMVGKEREGIALMFHMMNEARIGVAGQGTAIAGAAYHYAVDYAKDRVQGTKLTKRDSDAERVAITSHPDVRRMLMTLKVIAETTRAACIRMVFLHDIARNTTDEQERARCEARQDILIPVLKAHCTDLGFEMAALAVQVYGGYGYLGEYPVEQLVRDAKIQSIYEGTNGIQALDLVGRKLRAQGGAVFMGWMSEAQAELAAAGAEGFTAQADVIGKSLAQLGACAMHLGKTAAGGNVDGAFIYAVPLLRTMGVIQLAFEALEQARVAKRAIAASGETPLLRGKLLNLDFYVAHILPQAIATAKSVQSGDESCLDPSLFT
ncbi:MAG: acyl-CoA dehydrogenase [Deltaproteobacteria bacterium]|nr:acyl-CoA dehydrogenase [Deltaproteobacteria bacterium]